LRDSGVGRLKAASVVLSLRSSGGARNSVVDALHIIRDDGSADPRLDPGLSEEDAVRLYRGMSLQRILDNRMLALQRQGRIGFYGVGETSTTDFHAAMNFAGAFRTPTVFLCNNNQWAISVPVAKQTASATLAQKAPAYGFDGVRVDGMDALAVFRATGDAARRAREGHGPTMIEAVTYRLGPHSSSDDPSRYRDESEVALWRARDPIARYRRYLEHAGWWDDGREARLEQEIGDEITRAIQEAERAPPPAVETLFTDVYADMPDHL